MDNDNNEKYNLIIDKLSGVNSYLGSARVCLKDAKRYIDEGVIISGKPIDNDRFKINAEAIEEMIEYLNSIKQYCNDNIVVTPPVNVNTVVMPNVGNNGMHIGGMIQNGNATINNGSFKPGNSFVGGLGGNYGGMRG